MNDSPSMNISLNFLARHRLYETTKPYVLDYVSRTLPPTNELLVTENVQLHDLRGVEDTLTFARSGFAILDLHSRMSYEDFSNHDKIVECYFQEVGHALLDYLGASSIRIFDYAV